MIKHKRLFMIACAAFLSIGLVALNTSSANAGFFDWLFGKKEKKEEVIKIGSTLPLSGDAAVWGKNTQDGINLAVEEINASGGVLGRKLVVVYEDTKALPKEGVSAEWH